MTSTLPDLSRATLNQIIFEGRNQTYGAYELRVIYPRHLRRAALVAFCLSAALMATPLVLADLWPAEVVKLPGLAPVEPTHKLQPVPEFDKPLPPPVQPAPVAPPVVTTTQFVRPRVVAEREPDVKQTTMEIANAAPNLGTQNQVGVDAPATPVVEPAPVPVPESPDAVFINVEQMPEYPGGNAALLRYLAQHTRYPALALRNSIEGRVFIKFVVDETGQVVNPVVVKGIGGGCDEEALRVLKTVPRFTPGQQNGRAVKVYFNLPITFTMGK